jgi:hypothetical protein
MTMTALGAALYGGFFGLAALWLFVTSEGPAATDQGANGQGQRPDFSNSTRRSAGSAGSNPMLVSHSSSK